MVAAPRFLTYSAPVAAKLGEHEPFISKSKFLSGLQCHKLLWFAYNQKAAIPEPDAATQAIFDQGHEVGALTKQMFPGGVEVGDGILDLDETIRLTQKAIKLRKPMFEAAFAANGGYCRVDILRPAISAISILTSSGVARLSRRNSSSWKM